MSVLPPRVKCDGCGKVIELPSLQDSEYPRGWWFTLGYGHHACGRRCHKVVDAEWRKNNHKLLLWMEMR